MNRSPRVSFVVCTRNNRDVIAETLGSLAGQTLGHLDCTVVDGCSDDGTPDLVRARFPRYEVLVKDTDSGPAASRNLGMARSRTEIVVLVDSDVSLCPDWVEKQVAFMDREAVDVACGKLVYASEPGTLNAAYGAMNRYAVAWDGGVGRPATELGEARRCLWTVTAAMALRRRVFEDMGGFDEDMFAFHEDSDFGWRANLFGYRAAFNPEVTAYHRQHSTMNRRTMGERIVHLVCRNRVRSALVNYEAGNAARYLGAYLALATLDAVGRGPRKPKLNALLWNLRHLRGTLERRRFVQSRRRVPDRELWPLFEPGVRGPGFHYA
jgi:GT2 family glycosyltransferase